MIPDPDRNTVRSVAVHLFFAGLAHRAKRFASAALSGGAARIGPRPAIGQHHLTMAPMGA